MGSGQRTFTVACSPPPLGIDPGNPKWTGEEILETIENDKLCMFPYMYLYSIHKLGKAREEQKTNPTKQLVSWVKQGPLGWAQQYGRSVAGQLTDELSD